MISLYDGIAPIDERCSESDSFHSKSPIPLAEMDGELSCSSDDSILINEPPQSLMKKTFCEKVKHFVFQHTIFCWFFAWLSFTTSAALLLWLLEGQFGTPANDLFVNDTNFCVSGNSYWDTIIYVFGLVTAVGITKVTVCVPMGKFLAVIYTVIGLPLTLLVLNNFGNLIAQRVARTFIHIRMAMQERTNRKLSLNQRDAILPVLVDAEFITVPAYVGIIMTVLWVSFAAMVFTLNQNWNFGESTYFTITMLTLHVPVDITEYGPSLTFFSLFTVFVGLSLISNCVKIVQMNIESLVKRIEVKMKEEFQANMLITATTNSQATLCTRVSQNSIVTVVAIPESESEMIARLCDELNAPAWMRGMMSNKQMNQLQSTFSALADLTTANTQTDPYSCQMCSSMTLRTEKEYSRNIESPRTPSNHSNSSVEVPDVEMENKQTQTNVETTNCASMAVTNQVVKWLSAMDIPRVQTNDVESQYEEQIDLVPPLRHKRSSNRLKGMVLKRKESILSYKHYDVKSSQTDNPMVTQSTQVTTDTTEKGIQIHPNTRTVLIQFPRKGDKSATKTTPKHKK